MSTFVSVLLPYRDAAPTLNDAIESILAQCDVRVEILAVDDGSCDDGPQRVATLAAKDPRIVPLESGGVGIARSLALGLEHATSSSWIARMDADDVCAPSRLAKQVALLERDAGLGVVGTQVEGFPSEAIGEGLRRYIDWQNGLVTREDHARQMFVESPLCHPSVVIRRNALDDVGGWRDVVWPEDYDLWLRLDAAGWGLAKVPEVLFSWRHRIGRATFSDPRYALERFNEAKALYLAPKLLANRRPIAVWGAGRTGRAFARALERNGVRATRFIDVDPKKIGRIARGVSIVAPDALRDGENTVVVAVGARGARDLIRTFFTAEGWVEGRDYVCAA